jgi:hypothetical protein
MKRINIYILKNADFLHGVFAALQWVLLLIFFAFEDDNALKKQWLEGAFVLSGIGYLSFILFPIILLQCKLIFRDKSEKYLCGIIIILFYSEIIFIFQLLFTVVFSRDDPLFCYANTGAIFAFSCFKRLLNGKNI